MTRAERKKERQERRANRPPIGERPGFQKFMQILPGLASGIARVIPGGAVVSSIIDGLRLDEKLKPEEKKEAEDFLVPIALEEAEYDIEDMKNAREMEQRRMESSDWFTRNVTGVLAILWTIVTVVVLFIILVKGENISADVKNTILNATKDIEIMVMMFYFGSSIGSKMKTVAMSKQNSND